MPNRVSKRELDTLVARMTGEPIRKVSYITETFFEELADALSSGGPVQIRGFGEFSLKKQRGVPPEGALKNGGTSTRKDHGIRFRVCFTKSAGLRREIWRKFKEKHHGKVWR